MECHLLELLQHNNPLVAIHVMIALKMMKSPVFDSPPEGVMERRNKVSYRIGSFLMSTDFGGMVRVIRKEWQM